MKHLSKFITYIKESDTFNISDIENVLIPLKHLDIDYTIGDNYVLTSGSQTGKECIKIIISLDKKRISNDNSFDRGVISDNKFWDLLDEILSIRAQLESKSVSILIDTRHEYAPRIELYLVDGEVDTNTDKFKLKAMLDAINKRHYACKSDFCYSLTKDMKEDSIEVNVNHSYTERKWKGFMRAVDDILQETGTLSLSDFDITGKETNSKFEQMFTAIIKIKK